MRSRNLNERGSISIAAVFGATVLATAVLVVLNTGAHSGRKIKLQNAADAAGISAAVWMARALNVISMNNVIESQLLALAILIPSLYGGIQDAIKVIHAEMAGCAALGAGAPACEAYLAAQEAALLKVEVLLTPTIPATEPPSGALWVLMRALQAESVATAEAFPGVAMAEALRIARENGADSGLVLGRSATAGMTLAPRLPVHVGSFAELCDATRYGSPTERSRGYYGLLEYPLGIGPLQYYTSELLDNFVTSWVSLNTGLSGFVRRRAEAKYAQVCGDPAGDWKPRPVRFDGGIDTGSADARARLDFVGVARTAIAPAVGGARWDSPIGRTQVAYAQARVYNATAFDLFTQDWRVKLVPARALDDGLMGSPDAAGSLLGDHTLWTVLGRLHRAGALLNNH